ncbi:MAG: hypothetical protein ABI333_22165 [bacterium]
MHQGERRVRRTENKKLAMTWFLQSCILRLGMRALVLGCKDGLVVASAGEGVSAESAAAFAPYVFHESWEFPDDVEDAYYVDVIPLSDTALYLFAVGPASAASLSQGTKGGIRRILDEAVG